MVEEYADTCVGIFHDAVGAEMGYRYQDSSGYQIVFIYWPIHSIHLQDLSAFDTLAQDTLVRRTLGWFGYETCVEENEPFREPVFITRSRPNPFRKQAFIEYQLPLPGNVRVVIYNLAGQVVKTLVDQEKGAGVHTVVWSAMDNSGRQVPSGAYFLRLEAGQHSVTRKLAVVR
jgi:hypothetical protein